MASLSTQKDSPDGVCCFCGRPFSVAGRSKEHIVPQWLLEYANVRRDDSHYFTNATPSRPIFHRSTPAYSHAVNKVCGACNSGWLSALEETAKSIWQRIDGQDSFDLDWTDCFLLSAWFFKIFALTHLTNSNERRQLIRLEDLRALESKLYPEGHVFLSLCRTSRRFAKLSVQLLPLSYSADVETELGQLVGESRSFAGLMVTSDLVFVFTYLYPPLQWRLVADSKLAGEALLWPVERGPHITKASLPDIPSPEALKFQCVLNRTQHSESA